MSDVSAILVRHGAYEQPDGVPSAWLPHGLVASGFEEARAAARAIVAHCAELEIEVDARIDCSTLLRAYQTATAMKGEFERLLGREFRVVEWRDLAERGVGAVANLTTTEIEALLEMDPRYDAPPAGWKASGDYRLPFQGAESLREAGFRVARFLRASLGELARHSSGRVARVFVGHGAAFRWASVVTGVLDEARLPILSMHHCGWVHVAPDHPAWNMRGGAWKHRPTGEPVTD